MTVDGAQKMMALMALRSAARSGCFTKDTFHRCGFHSMNSVVHGSMRPKIHTYLALRLNGGSLTANMCYVGSLV